jgi:hypothetical protein
MSTRLARWLSTSPNGTWQVRGTSSMWVPHLEAHAREVGAALTACGRFAVGWELFWDLPFDAEAPGVCQACVDAMRVSLSKPGARRPTRTSSTPLSGV